uniref:Polymorphic mucin variant n=3 Tax=Schistosoma mansoni TaxID=6183 RepID=A0A5K4FH92_SCHMA
MNKKIILLTIIYVALMIRDDYALSEPTDDYALSEPTDDYALSEPTDDYALSEPTDDYALSEPTVPEHLKTRIKHYKDAYYNSSIQKFLSLEPYTRASSTRAPQIYHEECLRLEKLYFTKWAVHYLSKNGASDITLLQSYENEYEEAKKGDENADPRRDWGGRLRASISEKWKEREILDDVESAYIAEPRTNVNVNIEELKKQLTNTGNNIEAQLNNVKELESKAIQAANKHMNNRVLSLEPYTRASSTRAPQIYHEECLRLEKLYFTKWAVHYLSKNGATDITLLQSYENEYEEAKKGDENADPRRDWGGRLRASISKKWKEREILDDVESAYIAEPRTNVNVNKEELKKQLTNTGNNIEAQLNNVKELESKAIQAANKHMNNRDDKSLEEQAYEAYSTLGEELRSLVDLMGEAEFQRILLLTTLPKDEQIKMIIQAMDKDSTNCS